MAAATSCSPLFYSARMKSMGITQLDSWKRCAQIKLVSCHLWLKREVKKLVNIVNNVKRGVLIHQHHRTYAGMRPCIVSSKQSYNILAIF